MITCVADSNCGYYIQLHVARECLTHCQIDIVIKTCLIDLAGQRLGLCTAYSQKVTSQNTAPELLRTLLRQQVLISVLKTTCLLAVTFSPL